tara:strand:- start:333 stop:2414 length:2082 start_codon:yes stop_codon:yes gene_type:complete
MNITYKQHLENLLKKDARLIDEQGELMGNKVKSLADDLDEKLITLLLDDKRSREQFFIKIKEVYVFKASDFKFFLEQNKIDNSFTNYINQIGLTTGGKFLKDNTDVVLDFPYKDCILEGGQSTEEGLDTYFEYDEEVSKPDEKKGYKAEQHNQKQAKRKEIFFNTIVAKDEIDRLTEPKAFSNILKYDKKGSHKPTAFTRDAAINKKRGLPADTITDNLIIKGNNLLALHSLEKEFKEKVKLIYIDPPYYFREKKLEDTFNYNSNFRLSGWLSFMHTRIQVAKKLLTNDGIIFISINEDGLCYLKILMDEIFDIKNFIEIFTWKKSDTPSNLSNKSKKATEYILCYEKNKDNIKYKGLEKTSSSTDPLTKPKNSIKTLEFLPGQLVCKDESSFYSKGEGYGTDKYPMELLDDLTIENNTNKNTVRFSNRFTWTQPYLKAELENRTKIFCSKKTLVLSYKKEEYEVEAPFDLIDSTMGIQTSEGAGNDLTKLFGQDVFKYPKSESLMKYLIDIVGNKFNKNDIILDYHLGSGTTASTAHKLGCQYIGVEQMDYINHLIVPRLEFVINDKDNYGITKIVDWKGGGSFIYLELAKNNQTAKDKINACNNYKELIALFEELYSNYFLHYNLKIKEFKEVVSKEDKFVALPLTKQKEMFCLMLDNNQLYVNQSEMEDSKHGITLEDIALTKDFYQLKD